MKVYWVLEDPGAYERGRSTVVSGSTLWGLPGVTCSQCGRSWAGGGLSYPTIDLGDVPEAKELETARNVPLAEYERLVAAIRPVIPPETVLGPSTRLGPVRGEGNGNPADIVWLVAHRQMFISESALQQLEKRDVALRTGPAHLSWSESRVRFREVEAPPCVDVEHTIEPGNVCERCGWQEVSTPEWATVIPSSLRGPLDVVRGRQFTNWLFATERFATAVLELGLTGILLSNVSETGVERSNFKVARLGIEREEGWLYFVRDRAVWRLPRGGPRTHPPEKVADADFDEKPGFHYFLDGDGDVTRIKRSRG